MLPHEQLSKSACAIQVFHLPNTIGLQTYKSKRLQPIKLPNWLNIYKHLIIRFLLNYVKGFMSYFIQIVPPPPFHFTTVKFLLSDASSFRWLDASHYVSNVTLAVHSTVMDLTRLWKSIPSLLGFKRPRFLCSQRTLIWWILIRQVDGLLLLSF